MPGDSSTQTLAASGGGGHSGDRGCSCRQRENPQGGMKEEWRKQKGSHISWTCKGERVAVPWPSKGAEREALWGSGALFVFKDAPGETPM